jgi:hypothetical protein
MDKANRFVVRIINIPHCPHSQKVKELIKKKNPEQLICLFVCFWASEFKKHPYFLVMCIPCQKGKGNIVKANYREDSFNTQGKLIVMVAPPLGARGEGIRQAEEKWKLSHRYIDKYLINIC